jgi:hypothetical protein
MKHTEWKCRLGPDKCDQCNYDSHFELFICEVCGGAEGTLPTDCPGVRMDAETEDKIYAGKLDYIDGKGWVTR